MLLGAIGVKAIEIGSGIVCKYILTSNFEIHKYHLFHLVTIANSHKTAIYVISQKVIITESNVDLKIVAVGKFV